MKRLICAFCLCVLALPLQAASFSASVDRNSLSEGETFNLILQSDDVTEFGMPDLAPLRQDFELLGTRQENHISNHDGRSQSSTRWIITLLPQRTGTLAIPPLSLGQAKSQALPLEVKPASESGSSAPVYIEASLDRDSVYVQAQALLTLRIYHSVSLYDDSSLTPPKAANTRIEQLGEPKTFETTINGVRHGVIELRYALFPQQSGPLQIEQQVFSATIAERGNAYNPFAMRQGRLMRIRAPQLSLEVKAKPNEWPSDAPWLPAQQLQLSQAWTSNSRQIPVGDSLTRNIMLRVEGLSSTQLPALPNTEITGLKRYPDQPQLHNETSENGVIGSREESVALVPNQIGELLLPAIEILWWNTELNQMERTSLPPHTLEVIANPALENLPSASMNSVEGSASVILWPWQLACSILSLTTILGFALWWHARHQPAIVPNQSGPSPRTLLDDLKRACNSGDPQASRQALDAWARQQPETLAAMAARFAPLSTALDGLNGALYSETSQDWQGESLWKAIRSLPALEDGAGQEASPLPPLYPR